MIKIPSEEFVNVHSIKGGFCNRGVFPFNSNAIDKTHLSRNHLVPLNDNYSTVPPECFSDEVGVQTHVGSPTDVKCSF